MELVDISRLKEVQRGTVTGQFFPSSRKPVFYDSQDSIEVVIFGDLLIEPWTLYRVTVSELVLGGCLPVSSSNLETVPDEEDQSSEESLLVNEKLRPSDEFVTDFRIFVREKCNFTKQDAFHVEALLSHTSLSDPINVTIHNIESTWFLYVVTGRFYHVELESAISLESGKPVLLDLSPTEVGEVSFTESGDVADIMRSPHYRAHDRRIIPFSDMKDSDGLPNQSNFARIKCVVVSTSSFKTSGLVACVDGNNEVQNIGFSPAYKALPRSITPGAEVILSHLLVKTVKQNRRFITATKLTRIILLSLPKSFIPSSGKSTSLYEVQSESRTGLVGLIVSVDCILSLSISSLDSISCKLGVCDSTGTATLHIRDNLAFVEDLLQLTDADRAVLADAKLDCGKVEDDTNHPAQRIFLRLLESRKRFYIQGIAKHDTSCYCIGTQYGRTLKHSRVNIFPYSISHITTQDLLTMYMGDL